MLTNLSIVVATFEPFDLHGVWSDVVSEHRSTCESTYLWNIIHCAAVAILSWLSLRADSRARTESSVYAMFVRLARGVLGSLFSVVLCLGHVGLLRRHVNSRFN